jgi:ribosomal protein S18 acetylase RimI-like enzyme
MDLFNYRTATQNDFDQVFNLIIKSFSQFRNILSAENWIRLESNVSDKEKISELFSKATTFVCDNGRKITGAALFLPAGIPSEIYPREWCCIRLLTVDPEIRGVGIGRKLMQMCINYARSGGEKTIALHSGEMMENAIRLYESLGFSIEKELEPAFGRKYFLYRLDL